MPLPTHITIREVGCREGFQHHPAVVPTIEKLRLIDKLSSTGLKHIEVTSFVHPKKVPQMGDAEELVRDLTLREGITYSGLYLNQTGFERAEKTGRLSNDAWLPIATSDLFLKNNINSSIEDLESSLPQWLEKFKDAGKQSVSLMVSTVFGTNEEGPISNRATKAIIDRLVSRLLSLGTSVREICLADTMGWGNPVMVSDLVRILKDSYKHTVVSLHLHDTRGAGLVNAYAGLLEGVTIFDSSIGGIGGCPFAKGAAGNIATEDLVYLCHQLGISTGIDAEKLLQATSIVHEILDAKPPSKVYATWLALGKPSHFPYAVELDRAELV